MKKQVIALLILLPFCAFILSTVLFSGPVLAQSEALNMLKNTNLGGDTQTRSLPVIIGDIIKVFLSVLGIVFVILVVYAGFKYMTSQGDKGKTETARNMIVNATIGLAIILVAYALTDFVIRSLITATTGQAPT